MPGYDLFACGADDGYFLARRGFGPAVIILSQASGIIYVVMPIPSCFLEKTDEAKYCCASYCAYHP